MQRLVFSMSSTLDPDASLFTHCNRYGNSGGAKALECRITSDKYKELARETLSSKFDVDESKGVRKFYINPNAKYTLVSYSDKHKCFKYNVPIYDGGYYMMTKDGQMVLYCWYVIEFNDDYIIIHYESHSPISMPAKGHNGNMIIDCEVIDEYTGEKGMARGATFITYDECNMYIDTRNVVELGKIPPGTDVDIKVPSTSK